MSVNFIVYLADHCQQQQQQQQQPVSRPISITITMHRVVVDYYKA